MSTRADEAMEKTVCPTADDYDDYDEYEKTGMTIWVSNSCGELFIFNNVPDDPRECGWWEDNKISDVVGNNQNSCEWGAFHGEAKITRIQTPPGGWRKEERGSCEAKGAEDG